MMKLKSVMFTSNTLTIYFETMVANKSQLMKPLKHKM